MTSKPPSDMFVAAYGITRADIVYEAFRLIGVINGGECVSPDLYNAGDFHLQSLEAEYPSISYSRMAHKLAARLRLDLGV